ncbi:zinc-ribbon domain-containing protein [Swingsia samuiensis]|uniref:Zinc finger/thioredoxin putative domain-containing protein n=1 Tax=Swingsia samuiensis TaxID=1293412 RepID=A0A4Y6UJ30_9PROT|nr:zinc-ribbon domain-containing protein [Swingsia samuiensis]QDH16391.1 hypothetical protein E3D00_01525 [Swingsia samuiensis]
MIISDNDPKDNFMRLECPHCHAVFEVPQNVIEQAHRLRCANCKESWSLPEGLEANVIAPQTLLKKHASVTEGGAKPNYINLFQNENIKKTGYLFQKSGNNGNVAGWLAAWGASAMLVSGAALAAWHWQQGGEVTDFWSSLSFLTSPKTLLHLTSG